MGRSHLERGDDSDGDCLEHAVTEVLGDVGGSDVAGGEVSAGKINPKADEDLNPEPMPTKTKRVAGGLRPPSALIFNEALEASPCVEGGRNPPSIEDRPGASGHGCGTTKTKRVASEKMKAALQRARKAKAEKREKDKQSKAISYAPQFFFDVV